MNISNSIRNAAVSVLMRLVLNIAPNDDLGGIAKEAALRYAIRSVEYDRTQQ